MPDFGIAHLAFRQADILTRGVQETMRAGLPQPVKIRRVGLTDGIVTRIVAPAPAIQNDQHRRPPPLHHQPPLIEVRRVLRIAAASSIAISMIRKNGTGFPKRSCSKNTLKRKCDPT